MKTSKSILVVCANENALQEYAKNVAKDFHKADVFWLTGELNVKETVEFMERAHLAPVGDGKLMIIFDQSTMTLQAQNKMLKTIEDAPAQTTFLLLATKIERVINTVKSRCRTIYLPNPSSNGNLIPKEVIESLRNTFNIHIDEKTLNVKQKAGILDVLAKMNRNIAFNCNEKNQQDLLIMEIIKNANN